MNKIKIEELQDDGQFVSDLSDEELNAIDGGLTINAANVNGTYYVNGKKTSKKAYNIAVKNFNQQFNKKFGKAFDFSFDDFF